jgi:membrane peptidoglycan carboxypeptidase
MARLDDGSGPEDPPADPTEPAAAADSGPPAKPVSDALRGPSGWQRLVSRLPDFATGEQRIVPRIDLSEAYAAVRRRGEHLRRRRIISSVIASIVFASLLTVLGVYYVSSIPLPDALSLPATTTVYYSDGTTVMARLGSQRRVMLQIATVPANVRNAVLAAVDPSFFGDSSTIISRQYARAATGLDSSSATGKARLLVMSWKLEDSYSKEQILEFYLNTVYFGRGAYGIEAAAQAYFGKSATSLTLAEAIVLAGLIASPGDGQYDPTVNSAAAQQRFADVARGMVALKTLDEPTALSLRIPHVNSYDPAVFESDLDLPTGLVVSQVLAELRQIDAFRGKAPGYIENGGYRIVTTVDAGVQALLQRTADPSVAGAVMQGQPENLQAAAAVVEPGTGRVIAYYGGHDGTGADYAGSYTRADGTVVNFGAHPPGNTVGVYTLAAGLEANVSVDSTWDSPVSKAFPASGRPANSPVLDVIGAPCQPRCTLAQAATGGLVIPYVALAERVGPAAVLDAAKAAGIDAMWTPATPDTPARRFDLRSQAAKTLVPVPFGGGMGLGEYPVTVLDQANAMATLAAGGKRSPVHFVSRVTKNVDRVYAEPEGTGEPAFSAGTVADLTWALSQNPTGNLPDGRISASQPGVGRLRSSAVETAHAWMVGYTPSLAMAVWIGNVETEFPLKDREGARVTGEGLPAQIYRVVLSAASDSLGLPRTTFPPAVHGGDGAAGDATAGGSNPP